MKNIYLCSFADTSLHKTLDRLRCQANEMGVFKDIYFYDESNFGDLLEDKFGNILNKYTKGYGYWLWKPYFILQSLNHLQENDILLYVDAGCHLNSKGIHRFMQYIEIVKHASCGILLTTFEGKGCLTRKWTKGDLLDFFNVKNNCLITNSPQRQASVIFIRKCEESMKLLNDWYNIYESDLSLVDDTPSKNGDLEGFIEHRYDQSVLSILSQINQCATISVRETQNKSWLFMNSFPIWVKRDKGNVNYTASIKDIIKDLLYYIKIKCRIFINDGRIS